MPSGQEVKKRQHKEDVNNFFELVIFLIRGHFISKGEYIIDLGNDSQV